MNDSAELKLEAPGAGLPLLEHLFLRYIYYPFKVPQTLWSENLARFQKETEKIIKICERLDEKNFQMKILIPRLYGMEDSSRYWSAGLALEHLCITMKGMSFIVTELSSGRTLSTRVDTASVKPKQEDVTTKLGMLEKFQKISKETFDVLATFEKNHSNKIKFFHPWFGPIDTHGWVWVIGQHQALHRKQIQMIVKQIKI